MAEEGINSNQGLFEGVSFDSFLDEFGKVGDTSTDTSKDNKPPEGSGDSEDKNSGQSNEGNLEGTSPGDNTTQSSTDGDGEDGKSDNDDSDDGSSNENSSPLIPYAKLLAEEGILPNFKLDEFEKEPSAEGLKSAMLNEITEGINLYKQSLPEEISALLDNYEEGVPLSTLLNIDAKKVEYSNIDDNTLNNDTELQKSLIKEYYKSTTRFSDDKIDKLVQRHEDLEELGDEAKSSLSELIKLEDLKEKAAIEDARKSREADIAKSEKEFEDFKKMVASSDEIVPGIPVNDNTKSKILQVLTTPVAQDENGNPLNAIAKARAEDPMKFERDLAYLWYTTKGFTDYSIFKGAGKNDAITDFEKSVGKFDSSNKGGFNPPKNNDKVINEARDAFEQFARSNVDDFFGNKKDK